MQKPLGVAVIHPATGDFQIVRRSDGAAMLIHLVKDGYRPIGPNAWRRLQEAGHIPAEEAYQLRAEHNARQDADIAVLGS